MKQVKRHIWVAAAEIYTPTIIGNGIMGMNSWVHDHLLWTRVKNPVTTEIWARIYLNIEDQIRNGR